LLNGNQQLRGWAIPAAVFLVLALAWSWPLPLHLTNRIAHDPGDPLLLTYLIWWNAHAVPLTSAYWNAPYFWPMRGSLLLTDHLAGLSPVTTPMQWLGAAPLTAYNLTLIASAWWCGLVTYALMRRLGGSILAAYVAGVAFAYAPYRASQLAHLQIYACWWLPAILLALHGFYGDRRARWLVLLAAAFTLQGLTNGYFLFFTPVLIACWLAWFTRGKELGAALRVVGALAVAGLCILPFLLEYRSVQGALHLRRSTSEMASYSAHLFSLLHATEELRFWHTTAAVTGETYLFPGVTALTLAIAGLVVGWRDSRLRFYLIAAGVMTWFCMGPGAGLHSLDALWHPFAWVAWLPGFSGLRVPSRFFMLAVLCLAVAAGLAFDAVSPRSRRGRAVLAVCVFAGLTYDGAIDGMWMVTPPQRLALHDRVAHLIALPFSDRSASLDAMYQSMTPGVSVVNGYGGYVPPHADVIAWALNREDASVLTELRRGVPLYVFVATTDQADEANRWNAFMDAQPDVERIGVEGGGRLYRLPPAPSTPDPRPGTPIAGATTSTDRDWMTLDLHRQELVRGVVIRLFTRLFMLRRNLTIQTSADGAHWTTLSDDRPGGAALRASLEDPVAIPIRIDLDDVEARYVRLNAPDLRSEAVTVLGQ
jgi:hypothetical protein